MDQQEIQKLLGVSDRWLNLDELRELYEILYPSQFIWRWDRQLKRGEDMSGKAVQEELGRDMKEAYAFGHRNLMDKLERIDAGEIVRHAWDSTYRAHIMGFPEQWRQAVFLHPVIEATGGTVSLGKGLADKIGSQFGEETQRIVEGCTDWYAIHVRHLQRRMRDTGGSNLSDIEVYKSKLTSLKKQKLQAVVEPILEEVLGMSDSEHLVPREINRGDVYDELQARLGMHHLAELAEQERGQMERHFETGEVYHTPIMITKALCLVDHLRTVSRPAELERATRETEGLIGHVDVLLNAIHRYVSTADSPVTPLYNNVLLFLAAVMKTELVTAMDIRVAGLQMQRDSTFIAEREMLEHRLENAERKHGKTARDMGYDPGGE